MNKQERGSEIVQFVFVAPLLLVIVVAIMQLASVMLIATQVSSDITRSCQQLDVSPLLASSDHETYLEESILDQSKQLVSDRLAVSEVEVKRLPSEVVQLAEGKGSLEQFSSIVELDYVVRYEIPATIHLPGFSSKTLARHVACTFVEGRVIEVRIEERV